MELITQDIRDAAAEALDSLLLPAEQGGLGKRCRLVFDSKKTRCPNCLYDVANKRSTNHYRPGGPQPFPDGSLCPVCSGKGTLDTPVTEEIILSLNWDPKSWVSLPGLNTSTLNLEVPGGAVQTKGFMRDLPRVLRSRKLVVQTDLEGVIRYTYNLAGEPFDPSNILQSRYFYATWSRSVG